MSSLGRAETKPSSCEASDDGRVRALKVGHTLKCLLRRQTTSQRDFVHQSLVIRNGVDLNRLWFDLMASGC